MKKVAGTKIVFDVLTTTAGGTSDYARSRSFILTLLSDGSGDKSPIGKALATQGDWYVNEDWMKANVGTYVESVDMTERRNNVGDAELKKREAAIRDAVGGELYYGDETWPPMRWAQCHNFTLEATLTDAKWASKLKAGQEFGTTAYDVWWADPQSTESWKSAGKAKKPAAKKSAATKKPAKTPAKKSAAKKPAAKKSAKRKK
ncbi:MAG: hypothetical protein QM831_32035 [Kofleriaceae bacterium]